MTQLPPVERALRWVVIISGGYIAIRIITSILAEVV